MGVVLSKRLQSLAELVISGSRLAQIIIYRTVFPIIGDDFQRLVNDIVTRILIQFLPCQAYLEVVSAIPEVKNPLIDIIEMLINVLLFADTYILQHLIPGKFSVGGRTYMQGDNLQIAINHTLRIIPRGILVEQQIAHTLLGKQIFFGNVQPSVLPHRVQHDRSLIAVILVENAFQPQVVFHQLVGLQLPLFLV